MVFDDKYQFLFQYFTADIIANRYAAWLSEIQIAVNKMGGGDYFTISEENLSIAVLDYFTDIARLKPFHNISNTNVRKIYAYGTYWMLRRNPIQQLAPIPQHFSYINEKVMVLMMLPKIMKEIGLDPNVAYAKDSHSILSFANLLFYNLRFRMFTPQSLELAIEGFISGYRLGSI